MPISREHRVAKNTLPACATFLEPLEPRIAPAQMTGPATFEYQDVDGDLVTITFSKKVDGFDPDTLLVFDTGGVDGSTATPQQLQRIDLAATGIKGIGVKVEVTEAHGNGQAAVGFVNGKGLDIGKVEIDGDLGRILAGDDETKSAGLQLLRVASLGAEGTSTQEPGGSLNSKVLGRVGTVHVEGDVVHAFFEVAGGADGRIGLLEVGGSIVGGMTFNSGSFQTGGDIGKISVGGNLAGGDEFRTGAILSGGTIKTAVIAGSILGGDGVHSGRLDGDAIGRVFVGGDIVGGDSVSGSIVSGGGRLSVAVMGSVIGGAGGGSGSIVTDGVLTKVEIGHDVRGGEGSNSGQIRAGEGLGKLSIGGDLAGGDGSFSGRIVVFSGNAGNIAISGSVIGGDDGSTSGGIAVFNGFLKNATVGGDLRGGDASSSARITASDGIGKIVIEGGIIGNGNSSAVVFSSGGVIKSVMIGGGIDGSLGEFSARVNSIHGIHKIQVDGDVIGDAGFAGAIQSSSGFIKSLTINGSLIGGEGRESGYVSALALGKITITGDIIGGAGRESGFVVASTYNGDAKSITVGGSVIGGEGTAAGGMLVGGKAGKIQIGEDVVGGSGDLSGVINVFGALRKLGIGGNLQGGDGTFSGMINPPGSTNNLIGKVVIAGSILGGDGDRSGSVWSLGSVKSLTVGEDILSGTGQSSGAIRINNTLGKLTVGGEITGTEANPVYITAGGLGAEAKKNDIAIRSLKLDGDVEHAVILAGYNALANNPLANLPAPVNGNAQIGRVLAAGDWTASSIVAGAGNPAQPNFGDAGDFPIGGATAGAIRQIKIAGAAEGSAEPGDSFGFVAAAIKRVIIGGMKLPIPAPGDFTPIGATGDFNIHVLA